MIMVQQIASVDNRPAIAALPLEFNNEQGSRQHFEQEFNRQESLQQQSQKQRSSAELSTNKSANQSPNQRENKQRSSENTANSSQQTETRSTAKRDDTQVDNKSEVTKPSSSSEAKNIERNDKNDNESVSSSATSEQENLRETKEQEQTAAVVKANESKAEVTDQELASTAEDKHNCEDCEHQTQTFSLQSDQEFDFVSYVEDLAEWSSADEQITFQATPTVIPSIDPNTSLQTANEGESIELVDEIDGEMIALTEEEVALLNKIQKSGADPSTINQDVIETGLTDISERIVTISNSRNPEAQALQDEALKQDIAATDAKVVKAVVLKSVAISDADLKKPENKQLNQETSPDQKQIAQADLTFPDQEPPDLKIAAVGDDKLPSVSSGKAEAPTKLLSPTSKQPTLAILSELSEEDLQLALSSIAKRVQPAVEKLEQAPVINQFIATMQGAVNEYKKQLQQGREPALDLNAMVNNALESIGGDVQAAQHTKIDASLSQFNAMLNLANNVNYSANLQQAQVLGVSDQQFNREINFQHTEGTKLANATLNNMQAGVDKAISLSRQDGQAQLAEKVRYMVNARSTTAEIRLDPPDLGGMNIKLNMQGELAQVNFSVQSQAAKDALDQAMPRLREMLQEQGIELGQSQVKQDMQQQQENNEQFAGGSQTNDAKELLVDDVPEQLVVEQRIVNGALGNVDYYA